MSRTLGFVCAALLSLGFLPSACSSGETVDDPLAGQAGMTGTPGAAGSTGAAGSGSPTGAAGSGSPTGVAGSSSKGGSTGVAGSPSSKGGSTGAAGSPSSKGGSTGAAGSGSPTGAAGSGSPTGAAGSGTTATTCVEGLSTAPQQVLITDFSDAVIDTTNEVKFGTSAASAQGGTSLFASGAKGTLAVTGGALTFSGMVEAPSTTQMYPYNGFSLYVNGPGCVNANTYTGISFKISNLTGTCPLEFGFSDSAHTLPTSDAARGSAPAGSYAAGYAVTAATTGVNFAATPTSPGSPAALVDPKKLIGIQFQFKAMGTTACTGGFTLDDIKYK
jgi:collagen type VII alpha